MVANGIGTQNALRFNGTTQYLKSTNAYTNTGTTLTMFVVSQRITAGGSFDGYVSSIFPGTLDYDDVRNFSYNQGNGSTEMRIDRKNGASATLVHPGSSISLIGTVKFDGALLTHYQKTASTTTSTSGASSGTFGCTSTSIGARQAGGGGAINEFTNTFIGEVLIYNSALNDTDRATVVSYLSTKWGV